MKHFFFIINLQKEKANTLKLLIIPIVKKAYLGQIYYYDPPICQNKRAITQKCYNF